MKPFIPKRFEPVVFGLLLTCLMTFMVSGIATVMALGSSVPGFFSLWFRAWMSSWAVAFPAVLVAGPLVRLLLARIVRPD